MYIEIHLACRGLTAESSRQTVLILHRLREMAYEYEALPLIEDSEDVYIRLLRLHPGPRSGVITCNIIATRLSEAPPFGALSYCWGKEHKDDTIYVVSEGETQDACSPGAALRVPGSIIPFLYRDRNNRSKEVHTLWIDSICVNQKDLDEKSVQVPKMREIYLKAEITISWLGLGTNRTAQGIEYAHKINKLYRRHCAKLGLMEISQNEAEERIDERVRLGDPGLEGLIKLLDRPYFERAWIVQEVVVSKSVLIFCGDTNIFWDVLQAAFAYLIEVTPWIWDYYPAHRTDYLYMLRFSETDWKATTDVPWWRVLLRHCMQDATDPRDKVYAYYGLTCQRALQKLQMMPDYKNTTTRSLFVQLATNALLLGDTEVFHVPRLVPSAREESDQNSANDLLPSWAPDWRWTYLTPGSLFHLEWLPEDLPKDLTFHSTGDSVFRVDFNVSVAPKTDWRQNTLPSHISLLGVTIARVTHLTPVWMWGPPPGRWTLSEQCRAFRVMQQEAIVVQSALDVPTDLQLYSPTNETFESAHYDTLMAGGTNVTQEERDSAIANFKRHQRILSLVPKSSIPGMIIVLYLIIAFERILDRLGYHISDAHFRRMTRPMTNRKTARLTDDVSPSLEYLGLVPALCELSDHVMLVQGVRTPLVFRPKGEASISREDAHGRFDIIQVQLWEFIGDCYVHGIMNGELWEDSRDRCRELWIV